MNPLPIEIVDALGKLSSSSVFIHFNDGRIHLYPNIATIDVYENMVVITGPERNYHLHDVKKVQVYK